MYTAGIVVTVGRALVECVDEEGTLSAMADNGLY